MKLLFGIISIMSLLFSGFLPLQTATSQEFGGGVNYPGEWYVGEGLKKGDYFSYQLCHVDYKECTDFIMNFWVEGDIRVGTEDKWLVQAVVYDGNKIVKGNMELGKIAPEPTGGSAELGPYRGAFKSSIVWLSAFATSYGGEGGEGPKKFSMPSWGKIGNIGGEQVRPTSIEQVTVRPGTFETVLISWKTGGLTSKIWIKDGFPFPIKANTWTHVAEGKAPQEYRFELLDYRENVQENPFSGIISTSEGQIASGCPQNYSFKSIKQTTKQFLYLLEVKYGPENPSHNCNIEWIINFKNKFDETEFLNQVQYDILVVDEKQVPIRSKAQEEGQPFLFSASGQVRTFMPVKESVGQANYVIWIYGLSPRNVVPPQDKLDFLQIQIPISGKPSTTPPPQSIPAWIKNNAGWWSNGQISDKDFVQGIQWLIENGIMRIPPTAQGSGTGTNEIPAWIKNNAGWWSNGQISDKDFVQGIQWLIENGIMRISK
jgi:hypothetical protein